MMLRNWIASMMALVAAPLSAQAPRPLPNGDRGRKRHSDPARDSDLPTTSSASASRMAARSLRMPAGPSRATSEWKSRCRPRGLPTALRPARFPRTSTRRRSRLTVTDPAGKTIVADAADALRFNGRGFTLRKALPIDQHIFALGDKTGPLDRRGGTFVDWNTDAFGFAPSSDPIYKSIPFYIGSDSEGRAYGLFLDNSWRSTFDFGHKDATRSS